MLWLLSIFESTSNDMPHPSVRELLLFPNCHLSPFVVGCGLLWSGIPVVGNKLVSLNTICMRGRISTINAGQSLKNEFGHLNGIRTQNTETSSVRISD